MIFHTQFDWRCTTWGNPVMMMMRWNKDPRNNRLVGHDPKTDDILAIIVMEDGVPKRGYLWKNTVKGLSDIIRFNEGESIMRAKNIMEVSAQYGSR